MANKDLKTRSTISNAVKTELLVQLKNYSKKSGVPISRLLDKSIELFLDKIKTAN